MLGSVHTLDRLDGRMTDEQRAQLFDMTVEQGGRLQRLIDELLLVAAAEHADVHVELEHVDIAELFASVASRDPRVGDGPGHVAAIDWRNARSCPTCPRWSASC